MNVDREAAIADMRQLLHRVRSAGAKRLTVRLHCTETEFVLENALKVMETQHVNNR